MFEWFKKKPKETPKIKRTYRKQREVTKETKKGPRHKRLSKIGSYQAERGHRTGKATKKLKSIGQQLTNTAKSVGERFRKLDKDTGRRVIKRRYKVAAVVGLSLTTAVKGRTALRERFNGTERS